MKFIFTGNFYFNKLSLYPIPKSCCVLAMLLFFNIYLRWVCTVLVAIDNIPLSFRWYILFQQAQTLSFPAYLIFFLLQFSYSVQKKLLHQILCIHYQQPIPILGIFHQMYFYQILFYLASNASAKTDLQFFNCFPYYLL